jgi:CDP-diacylglycerol--serine O-phosphatidyltransferase
VRFRPWRRREHRGRPLRKVARLPTLLTLGNGAFGTLSIMACLDGNYAHAALAILVAMVFDALDGKVARATGTTSQFGAQLDSLCDALTFGAAPAMLVWTISRRQEGMALLPTHMLTAACVFYCLAAIIRLARFNVETDTDLSSHLEFSGLPSPAAAGVVAATVVLWKYADHPQVVEVAVRFLPPVVFLLGVLMLSRVRYPHVVNKLLGGFSPFVQLVEMVVAGVLVAAFQQYALFVLFVGYALVGPLHWVVRRLKRPRLQPAPPPPAVPPAPEPPPKENEPLF